MAQSQPKGRPPLPGPRTASGRRKIDPRGAAIWYRIRDEGRRFALDERLSTEPSRLFWLGELTDIQVSTAFLVGHIYGLFERYHGKRRTSASPSYMRAYGSLDHDDPDDKSLTPEQRAELIEKIKSAGERMQKLQNIVSGLPVETKLAREVLEHLCVENVAIHSANLPSVRAMLDRIGVRFKIPRAREQQQTAIAITGNHRPPRRPQAAMPELDKQAWIICTRQLKPDITDEQIETAWKDLQSVRNALKDRAHFRRDKAQGFLRR